MCVPGAEPDGARGRRANHAEDVRAVGARRRAGWALMVRGICERLWRRSKASKTLVRLRLGQQRVRQRRRCDLRAARGGAQRRRCDREREQRSMARPHCCVRRAAAAVLRPASRLQQLSPGTGSAGAGAARSCEPAAPCCTRRQGSRPPSLIMSRHVASPRAARGCSRSPRLHRISAAAVCTDSSSVRAHRRVLVHGAPHVYTGVQLRRSCTSHRRSRAPRKAGARVPSTAAAITRRDTRAAAVCRCRAYVPPSAPNQAAISD
jgi:hypothetical protein